MKPFVLSKDALADLKAIAIQTELRWGKLQRNKYLERFDEIFNLLSESPQIGEAYDSLRLGYRKFPHASHMVFYRQIFTTHIEIIRILHQSMNTPSKI